MEATMAAQGEGETEARTPESAPQVLNLAPVVTETFEFRKVIDGEERKWTLRDDVPTGTLVWGLALDSARKALNAASAKLTGTGETPGSLDPADDAALEAAQAALETRTLHLCHEIFRNTYPGTTRAWITETFTPSEQDAIVLLFTLHRYQASIAQRSGGASDPAPTTTETSASPAADPA